MNAIFGGSTKLSKRFGYGVFESGDAHADVYGGDDVEYDREIGGPPPDEDEDRLTKGRQRVAREAVDKLVASRVREDDSGRVCSDGLAPLRGFVLAEALSASFKWFPPPDVPKDWVPQHKFTTSAPGPLLPGQVPFLSFSPLPLSLYCTVRAPDALSGHDERATEGRDAGRDAAAAGLRVRSAVA
jgi:hypothetical protein